MMGSKGLTEASKIAILKANYMAKRLEVHKSFLIILLLIIWTARSNFEQGFVQDLGSPSKIFIFKNIAFMENYTYWTVFMDRLFTRRQKFPHENKFARIFFFTEWENKIAFV